MQSVFITGTDTDAGKTFVSVLLLEAINRAGFRTSGFKPIAAGCEQTAEGLRNDDALNLQRASSHKLPYNMINPIALAAPIAPHIAAHNLGTRIDMQLVSKTLAALQEEDIDFLLVEGAGGWRLPTFLPSLKPLLNEKEHEDEPQKQPQKAEFLSEFVAQAKLPVILVVGMKLGCLNHAALTFEQIKRDNCELVGWIANQVDPDMDCYAENLASLHALIDAPFLAEVKHGQKSIELAEKTLSQLLA
ncbi:dethiobiotin synthase [Brumicola nitratireducens]|uniref:ATP-dependent dethiobiotin synthetase BioD n=1 Tax=Glaciecola nitratireducens (strain JCM 12485 / KCTC 12276 / FR1064) TaxID=1085623 RepID=G4QGF3_GLANF|nr:dethiobiotin synthase [Glaciecola nitratireducens]AEP29478.1 dethiobiotin synthase [Glaciecola nitratireducens FR1064]